MSRNQASESTQLRVSRVFFLSLLSHNCDDRLRSHYHRFVILCICWDTPSEKPGLWQLPIVSTVFKLVRGQVWFTHRLEVLASEVWRFSLFSSSCWVLSAPRVSSFCGAFSALAVISARKEKKSIRGNLYAWLLTGLLTGDIKLKRV